MDRSTTKRMAAVAISAGFVTALTMPTAAGAAPAGEPAELTSSEMVAAMERDLGLTPSEAQHRVASDLAASASMEVLAEDLDATYGGSWIADGQLVVAITDPASADQVRAAGAEPKLVTHSEAELDGVMETLNHLPAPHADEVFGWYVDVTSNSVVIEAAPDAVDVATQWAEEAGLEAGAVTVDTTAEQPELLYNVVGGDAYYPGSSRCSVGFSVSGGFVTAGHCGGVGTSTSGYNQVAQGTVQGSSFPGRDMGWVQVNSNWTPTPRVSGTSATVSGSSQAGVGSSICRSGSTTGWHCGTVQALNQTVSYPQGTVTGLTRTSVCAEPGDSGGSFITGSQAQGVTSGGSGNCSSGGTTYFQPINPILSTYGLSLTTG